MNLCEFLGRSCREPEIKRFSKKDGTEGVSAKITLAVDRRGKDAGADFIPCTAFGKTAEFVEKYVTKGTKLIVIGRYTTSSYDDKDGNKRYTTEITVDQIEFAESKSAASGNATSAKDEGQFVNISDSIDEELPFE